MRAFVALVVLAATLGNTDQTIADGPNTELAARYVKRGNAWFAKKNYENAIAAYTEAIRLDAINEPAYYHRGVARFDAQDYDGAIADFTEAIRLCPKNANTFNNRGSVLAAKKSYENAIADYTEALRLVPTYKHPMGGMAWVLATAPEAKIRDGHRAVELAKAALAIDENDYFIMSALAAADAETGNFDEAVRWQEKAFEIHNTNLYHCLLELYRKKQPYRQEVTRRIGPAKT
jgi:tetratricopeptide (TPR) repeat protein